jgi:hypothetical protein
MATTTLMQEASPLPQLIYSNKKRVVETQQFVFDNLWNKNLPSEQKPQNLKN